MIEVAAQGQRVSMSKLRYRNFKYTYNSRVKCAIEPGYPWKAPINHAPVLASGVLQARMVRKARESSFDFA
jgi:hypothetical protein